MVSGYENPIEFELKIFKTGKTHTSIQIHNRYVLLLLYGNKWVLPTPSFCLTILFTLDYVERFHEFLIPLGS